MSHAQFKCRTVPSVKATFHSTIFDIPMRPLREDERHRRRFTRQKSSATPVMVVILLNFARCTLPTHRNREVKSSLKHRSVSVGTKIADIGNTHVHPWELFMLKEKIMFYK